MRVLSLFNGMGCIWLALDKLGIEVTKRYSSEIDKHAIKVNDFNYPDTVQLGDVTQIKGEDLGEIDLLVGGSPCQGFSLAGKQLNFKDDRSKLFFEFVRLLDETLPKYFLLENVGMKREYQDIVTGILGVEPITINSNVLSAQSRKRIYWTNLPVAELKQPCTLKPASVIDWSNTTPKQSEGFLRWWAKNAEAKQKRGWCRIINDADKSLCLTARMVGNWNGNLVDLGDGNVRFITPLEAERLQTVPDHYTAVASTSQRYKMLGNGWTIDVIAYLLEPLALLA